MLIFTLSLVLSGTVISDDPIHVKAPSENIKIAVDTVLQSQKEIVIEGYQIEFLGPGSFIGTKVKIKAKNGIFFNDGSTRHYGYQYARNIELYDFRFKNVTFDGGRSLGCCLIADDGEFPNPLFSKNIVSHIEMSN